jgi:acetylornithine deacetylase
MSFDGHFYEPAVELLKQMISTPSVSGDESQTAYLIETFLKGNGKTTNRKFNNVWSISDNCAENAPVILLNSHHDTVRASGKWRNDPYSPILLEDHLYGLGSNDAGASVVALLAAFLHLSNQAELPYRLIIALTAEEETSGANGISSILGELGHIDLAVVGEPTEMQMAVAEKGLVVVDCVAEGQAGHAAREEGINAIYRALEDIAFIRGHNFPKCSDLLGPVKMTVTQINGGHQHNVVPARCEFVVDIRTNEHYSNQGIVTLLQHHLQAQLEPRSVRLNSSNIPMNHPIVKKGTTMGLNHFGSPTLSDQALMDFTSIKIGPGKSSRSHTADEFILLSEIEQGIDTYIKLLTDLNL